MTLVQSLAELEPTLTLWCMGVAPGNDDEVAQFAEVAAARNRVSQLVHQLELHQVESAAIVLSGATRAIARITRQFEATAQKACQSRAIVDKVVDAVQIAAKAAAVGLGL